MLQNVYLKSNEISFEVKRLQNIPALEIREKNGKAKSKGKSYSIGNNTNLTDINDFHLYYLISL